MRSLGISSVLLSILLVVPASSPAAAPAPGQLAAPAQPPSPADLKTLESSMDPLRITVVQLPDSPPDTVQRLWMGSICAVLAASAFDAASSWGKREANPLLASSNGNFGARGLAMKGGIAAAVLAPQWWFRKHKQLRTAFILANFADAAVFTAVSAHNLGVSGQ